MSTHRLVKWLRPLLRPASMIGIAIIALFWVGIALHISKSKSAALAAAIERGSDLARLMEASTVALLKGVDQKLLFLRLIYEDNPERFDLDKLADRASVISDVTTDVGLIGPDGYLRIRTRYS